MDFKSIETLLDTLSTHDELMMGPTTAAILKSTNAVVMPENHQTISFSDPGAIKHVGNYKSIQIKMDPYILFDNPNLYDANKNVVATIPDSIFQNVYSIFK